MKRWLIALGIVLVVVAAWALRLYWLAGEFKTLTPHFTGECTAVTGAVGAEDIRVNRRARQPSRAFAPGSLRHELQSRQIAQERDVELEIATARGHAVREDLKLCAQDVGECALLDHAKLAGIGIALAGQRQEFGVGPGRHGKRFGRCVPTD